MGQKVHPTGFRLGIATDWTSKWYAEGREFAANLATDLKIRNFLRKLCRDFVLADDLDRASGQQGQRHDSYCASGYRHWKKRRRH